MAGPLATRDLQFVCRGRRAKHRQGGKPSVAPCPIRRTAPDSERDRYRALGCCHPAPGQSRKGRIREHGTTDRPRYEQPRVAVRSRPCNARNLLGRHDHTGTVANTRSGLGLRLVRDVDAPRFHSLQPSFHRHRWRGRRVGSIPRQNASRRRNRFMKLRAVPGSAVFGSFVPAGMPRQNTFPPIRDITPGLAALAPARQSAD